LKRSGGSVFRIVIKLRVAKPRNLSSTSARGKEFSSSSKRADWLWGPTGIIFSSYYRCSPREREKEREIEKGGGGVDKGPRQRG
jgi:hypothetical protein